MWEFRAGFFKWCQYLDNNFYAYKFFVKQNNIKIFNEYCLPNNYLNDLKN